MYKFRLHYNYPCFYLQGATRFVANLVSAYIILRYLDTINLEFRSTSEKRSDKSYKTTNVKIVIKITKKLEDKED